MSEQDQEIGTVGSSEQESLQEKKSQQEVPSPSKRSSFSSNRGGSVRSSGRAVVEVRRKKISLLEKRKALSSGTKEPSKSVPVYISTNLSESEVEARLRAVQNAQHVLSTQKNDLANSDSLEFSEQDPSNQTHASEEIGETEKKKVSADSIRNQSNPQSNGSFEPSDFASGSSEESESTTEQTSFSSGHTLSSQATKEPTEETTETSVSSTSKDIASPPTVEAQGQQTNTLDSSNSSETKPLSSEEKTYRQSAPKIISSRNYFSSPHKIIKKKETTESPQNPPYQGPVILRAANYGPRPSLNGSQDSPSSRSKFSSGPQSEKNNGSQESRPFSRKPLSEQEKEKIGERNFSSAEPRKYSYRDKNQDFLEGDLRDFSEDRNFSGRVKSRKFLDGFDSRESSNRRGNGRHSFDEPPRKLTRHILDRVMDDEEESRTRSEASFRRAQKKRLTASIKEKPSKVIRDVVIPDTIVVGELANRMAISSGDLIKALMKLGVMVSINQSIDGDTAELVCCEFGHRPKRIHTFDIEEGLRRPKDRPEDLKPRPPVVTVMGHVDHGKTSLLDALRKTDVASKEFGGITQHIGAYQIVVPGSNAKITFIDTPGHAAFSEMRARGANITDIVILIVAADDGVNEQTIEAISHAKAANVPMIVAINKIDKPAADPQKVRNELLSHDVITEDFGGDVMALDISAKQGTNLDKLIEAILLQAEMLELKANPEGHAEGTVLEASIDKGRGISTKILVQKGTLHVGDVLVAGSEFGRVRTMFNSYGQKVKEAEVACPVEVFGLNGVPQAGDEFFVVDSESKARNVAETISKQKHEQEIIMKNKNSLAHMMDRIKEQKQEHLPIILKSDVQGTLEAIIHSLNKISVEGVSVQIIHSAIGDVNETDIMLAKASDAVVIGFNVKAMAQVALTAERNGIPLIFHTVVYELLDSVERLMKGKLAPVFEEHSLGKAELRVVFSKGKTTKIAGCYVLSGLIRRNAQAKVWRDGQEIFKGKISSMKREKDDIKESKEGYECGIIFEDFNDLQVGDIIECFELVEKKS